jgi:hypothetical protein
MKVARREEFYSTLLAPTGITWRLGHELDPARSAQFLASHARAFLLGAIKSLMIGLRHEGLQLLNKCNEWYSLAMPRAQQGEPIELLPVAHFSLAQCRWLLGPTFPSHDLTEACEAIRQEVAAITERKWEEQLGWWLPLLLEAGHAQDCVAAFERFCPQYPRATRGAARPRQNHSPAALCYLLAREQVSPGSTGQDRERLFDDYLNRNVDKMLDMGAYRDFARWVFLATQAAPGEPAQQAIQEYADRYA